MNNLANNLLELAQVNQDVSTITFQEVALDEVIYDAAKLLTTKHPSYQMIFSFEGDTATSQPSLLVKGNKSLLTTAFLNLMENACKFSQNKQVEVTLGVNTEGATVTFTDQGVGISAEDLKHIYEPFFRAENVKKIHGYGIGLPLTHRIMELHHGRILVSSELNRGTSVVLQLPKLF
ncbi:sensor histidine kinase KdpD [Siphonobacter sp. BAB-5385]|uniref:sensor histidine kinase n=1 Tax=Siphonobacter sp. BAB-5385 TaxID=1864822 RepID=UPI0020CC4B59|nr:HAMP domain-containing sensor histidine kinase [Siphonobacter sp. BAB-5385]